MIKNKPKKMVPKDGASDTESSGTLFSIFVSIRDDCKLPVGIPMRSLRRYTKILKEKRIIKKISYGTWEVENEQEATKFFSKDAIKDGANKSFPGGSLTQKDFPVTKESDTPNIDKRGHRLLLVITTPCLCLEDVRKYMDYKQRGNPVWVNGGRAGRYLKCWFGGASFSIYADHTVVEFHKSFFAEQHITTRTMAIAHFQPILTTFEDNVGQSIRIGKELIVKVSMEFEKVNSDYAKYCYNKFGPISFKVGDFWYKQDCSGGTMNEEGNEADVMDMLDKRITPSVMEKLVRYKRETGKDWTEEVQKVVTTISKILLTKVQLDYAQQQSLNIGDTLLSEKKQKNQDLPSYFG